MLLKLMFSLNQLIDSMRFHSRLLRPKSLKTLSKDTYKLILISVRKCKEFGIAQIIIKKNKIGELILLDFRTYYKAIIVNNVVLA